MKKQAAGFVFFLFLFSLFSAAVFESDVSALVVVKASGDVGRDTGTSIVQSYDHGFVVVGKTSSYGVGRTDILVAKFDQTWNNLWTKTLGGPGYDEAYAAVQTSDSSVVVTGYAESYGAGKTDLIICKFDRLGNHLWTKTLGGTSADYGCGIVETADYGFVVVGATLSFGAGSFDLLLAKFDSSGNHLWTKTLGGALSDYGRGIVVTSDGGFAVTGYTGSAGAGSFDVLLAKFDSSGNLMWSKTEGGANYEEGYSIVQTADHGLAVAGYTRSYGAGSSDFLVSRFDSAGTHLWSKTVGGPNYDYGYSLIEAAGGKLAVAGSLVGYGPGFDDLSMTQFDAAGNELWTRVVGGGDSDYGNSLIKTADDGIVALGYTQSYGTTGDVLVSCVESGGGGCFGEYVFPTVGSCSPVVSDAVLAAASPSPTVRAQTPTVTSRSITMTTICESSTEVDRKTGENRGTPGLPFKAKVVTPLSSSIHADLTLPEETTIEVSIFDVAGRKIGRTHSFSNLHRGPNSLEVPASNLKSGVYLILFEGKGMREFTKVVKIG